MRADSEQIMWSSDARTNPAAMRGSSIAAWLCRSEAQRDDVAPMVSFGRELCDAGLSLNRLMFHVGTLHPEVFAQVLAWTPNQNVDVHRRDDPATVAAGFPDSPFRLAASQWKKLAVRDVHPQFLGRAAGEFLKLRGVGEMVCAPFRDCDGRTVVVSFCVAAPNTFGEADHRIIDRAIVSLRQGRRR